MRMIRLEFKKWLETFRGINKNTSVPSEMIDKASDMTAFGDKLKLNKNRRMSYVTGLSMNGIKKEAVSDSDIADRIQEQKERLNHKYFYKILSARQNFYAWFDRNTTSNGYNPMARLPPSSWWARLVKGTVSALLFIPEIIAFGIAKIPRYKSSKHKYELIESKDDISPIVPISTPPRKDARGTYKILESVSKSNVEKADMPTPKTTPTNNNVNNDESTERTLRKLAQESKDMIEQQEKEEKELLAIERRASATAFVKRAPAKPVENEESVIEFIPSRTISKSNESANLDLPARAAKISKALADYKNPNYTGSFKPPSIDAENKTIKFEKTDGKSSFEVTPTSLKTRSHDKDVFVAMIIAAKSIDPNCVLNIKAHSRLKPMWDKVCEEHGVKCHFLARDTNERSTCPPATKPKPAESKQSNLEVEREVPEEKTVKTKANI